MPPQLSFFVSIAFSFIAWGIVTARYIWPELRLRQRAEALRPLLILHSFRFHRIGISGPRGRVARSAVCLRAVSGLWGHHCGDTRLAFADIAAQGVRRCRRMDLQSLGYSRSPQRFLSGQSRRAFGGAAGGRVFPPDFHRAATADYARTRFPNSSAT